MQSIGNMSFDILIVGSNYDFFAALDEVRALLASPAVKEMLAVCRSFMQASTQYALVNAHDNGCFNRKLYSLLRSFVDSVVKW